MREGVGQLPGGCDVEYKYLIRRRDDHSIAHWESCHNRQVRTIVNEKAVLLVTDPESMTQEELMRQVPSHCHCYKLSRGGGSASGTRGVQRR